MITMSKNEKPDQPSYVGTYKVHPLADLFPLMQGEDYEKLIESVKRYGVTVPIVLWRGQVIDGRNRLRAALAAGTEARIPKRNLPDDADPASEILRLNVHRRHLTPRERATLTVLVLAEAGELAKLEGAAAVNMKAGTLPQPCGRVQVGEKVAALAAVSTRTAETVLAQRKADPIAFQARAEEIPKRSPFATRLPARRSRPKFYSKVPRDPAGSAAFFRQRMTSKEIERLIVALGGKVAP